MASARSQQCRPASGGLDHANSGGPAPARTGPWGPSLTVDGAADGVGLGEVADAVEQLGAVALAVLFDGVYLRHGGGGVRPEDGLAVFSTGGVSSCVAAACGAHWTHTHNTSVVQDVCSLCGCVFVCSVLLSFLVMQL